MTVDRTTAPLKSGNSPKPHVLIVGCGYLGMRVGRQCRSAGWRVTATTRHRAATLRAEGFETVRFDWNDSRDLNDLLTTVDRKGVDRVFIAVSYDRNSRVDRYQSQVEGLSRLLNGLVDISTTNTKPAPDVVYISTTGVYHQTGGVWVDERSTTRPSREGGKAHLQAEAKLRANLGHRPWTILRLSGIYGPGRVPRAADVRAGRPIASPADGYLNLIHVDDAAAAARAALRWHDEGCSGDARPAGVTGTRSRLYLISDNEPVIRREFYQEIARQTRSAPPTFVEPAADAGVRFRSETDKRVCNRQMKRDLLGELTFPTYREGLRHVLGG